MEKFDFNCWNKQKEIAPYIKVYPGSIEIHSEITEKIDDPRTVDVGIDIKGHKIAIKAGDTRKLARIGRYKRAIFLKALQNFLTGKWWKGTGNYEYTIVNNMIVVDLDRKVS